MGSIGIAIEPSRTGWGELVFADLSPSTFRLRVAPTRLSACGF